MFKYTTMTKKIVIGILAGTMLGSFSPVQAVNLKKIENVFWHAGKVLVGAALCCYDVKTVFPVVDKGTKSAEHAFAWRVDSCGAMENSIGLGTMDTSTTLGYEWDKYYDYDHSFSKLYGSSKQQVTNAMNDEIFAASTMKSLAVIGAGVVKAVPLLGGLYLVYSGLKGLKNQLWDDSADEQDQDENDQDDKEDESSQ